MKNFLMRHQPATRKRDALAAGLGGLLAIFAVGGLSVLADAPLLMAPFGASCVLLFSVPSSPLSQPINVIGGHVVATVISLVLTTFLPAEWWALAIGVGLAITVMGLLRITHPPAGADPIVIMLAAPSFDFLFTPVLLGSLILVIVAKAVHRTTGTAYPLPVPPTAQIPAQMPEPALVRTETDAA
ncbi:HPP family protein [Kordiimonas aestuarii]|uniref:HPP family protein n=1 Tax=Kordiimonas aestuarii TaxID=1005925 RepID=UPI0021D0331C|nr:HPP family protein [Kordiimonas aestuarii]